MDGHLQVVLLESIAYTELYSVHFASNTRVNGMNVIRLTKFYLELLFGKFKVPVFVEGGKPGNLEENLLKPHETASTRIEPVSQRWEASV